MDYVCKRFFLQNNTTMTPKEKETIFEEVDALAQGFNLYRELETVHLICDENGVGMAKRIAAIAILDNQSPSKIASQAKEVINHRILEYAFEFHAYYTLHIDYVKSASVKNLKRMGL